MCKPRRMAGLLLVVVAALALPASANAGGSHLLKLYKVEKQVDVEGDASYDLSCNAGDYALDGMWRVDQVDQDNEWPGNVLTAVHVSASFPDASDKSEFHFRLENIAGGDAQVKLFLTCLGKDSEPAQSHTHSFSVSGLQQQTFNYGAGVSGGFLATDCPTGTISVAPGFEMLSGEARLVGSRTSLNGGEPPVGRNWAQAWYADAPVTIRRYQRCLTLKSSTNSGHAHRIVVSRVGGPTVPAFSIPGDYVAEKQAICGEHYKGLVHGFDTNPSDASYEYFLGMDPRIKTRAYRFYNSGPPAISVWTGVTCFKDKTT